MQRTSKFLIAFALAAAGQHVTAETADAGLITASSGFELPFAPEGGMGTSEPGPASPEIDHHVGPGPVGGVGTSQSTSSPPPGGHAAIIPSGLCCAPQLIAWLRPEGRIWLPPPFSSGVFHPPRFVA